MRPKTVILFKVYNFVYSFHNSADQGPMGPFTFSSELKTPVGNAFSHFQAESDLSFLHQVWVPKVSRVFCYLPVAVTGFYEWCYKQDSLSGIQTVVQVTDITHGLSSAPCDHHLIVILATGCLWWVYRWGRWRPKLWSAWPTAAACISENRSQHLLFSGKAVEKLLKHWNGDGERDVVEAYSDGQKPAGSSWC